LPMLVPEGGVPAFAAVLAHGIDTGIIPRCGGDVKFRRPVESRFSRPGVFIGVAAGVVAPVVPAAPRGAHGFWAMHAAKSWNTGNVVAPPCRAASSSMKACSSSGRMSGSRASWKTVPAPDFSRCSSTSCGES